MLAFLLLSREKIRPMCQMMRRLFLNSSPSGGSSPSVVGGARACDIKQGDSGVHSLNHDFQSVDDVNTLG